MTTYNGENHIVMQSILHLKIINCSGDNLDGGQEGSEHRALMTQKGDEEQNQEFETKNSLLENCEIKSKKSKISGKVDSANVG